jgi:hypothetical protein
VTLRLDRPMRLPGRARDLFAYVSVAAGRATTFDARLTVHTAAGDRRVITDTIPNLAGFLPWDRIHLNLGGRAAKAPITGISIAVRGEGDSTAGRLSFQVDDLGWTSLRDG